MDKICLEKVCLKIENTEVISNKALEELRIKERCEKKGHLLPIWYPNGRVLSTVRGKCNYCGSLLERPITKEEYDADVRFYNKNK